MSGAAATWRITLGCGCVYRVIGAPELGRPLICGVKTDDGPHGMRSITAAERMEPAASGSANEPHIDRREAPNQPGSRAI